jgi:hypothetical protein
MDWLKARSFRRLGSITATLSIADDDAPAAAAVLVDALVLLEELVLLDELELQAAAASTAAAHAANTTNRGTRCCFMATSGRG